MAWTMSNESEPKELPRVVEEYQSCRPPSARCRRTFGISPLTKLLEVVVKELAAVFAHLPGHFLPFRSRQKKGASKDAGRVEPANGRVAPKTCVVDETAFFASRWCASEVRGRRTRELLGDAMEDDFFQVKAWYSGSESDTWVMFELERRTRGRRGGTVVEEAFETVPDSGL
ncbi:hypothetical protein R3P38DRAFT_2778500 [Favolaschia claudopus]|uniref:NAC domain-containing protein n=1 Tax=Favolaschia claudopus TaxID=2862362 RepID=A0AAW0BIH0_9AGAR